MCSARVARVIAVATTLAVSGFSGPLFAVKDGSKPYKDNAFDAFVLTRTPPADLIIFDGQESTFNQFGVSRSNEEWEQGLGPLVVESQRLGFDVVQAGIATPSNTLIEDGLEAIEWGLQPSVLGPDGSFPEERETDTAAAHAIHPKSEFVERAAHTVILIQQSKVVPTDLKARAKALIPSIRLAAQHFIDSGDAAAFFAEGTNSSQLAFVAAAIFEAGYLAKDAAMMSIANGYMQQVLDLQTEDGIYTEKGGYDTNYQLNTVELVTTYTSLLTKGRFKATMLDANTRAVDWFLARVRPDGSIDTTGNSRTVACGPPLTGPGPKGPSIDQISVRLHFHAYLAGLVPEIGPVADQIQFHGQDYDHGRSCSE